MDVRKWGSHIPEDVNMVFRYLEVLRKLKLCKQVLHRWPQPKHFGIEVWT